MTARAKMWFVGKGLNRDGFLRNHYTTLQCTALRYKKTYIENI